MNLLKRIRDMRGRAEFRMQFYKYLSSLVTRPRFNLRPRNKYGVGSGLYGGYYFVELNKRPAPYHKYKMRGD